MPDKEEKIIKHSKLVLLIDDTKSLMNAFQELKVLKLMNIADEKSLICTSDGDMIPAGAYDNYGILSNVYEKICNIEDIESYNDALRCMYDTTYRMPDEAYVRRLWSTILERKYKILLTISKREAKK